MMMVIIEKIEVEQHIINPEKMKEEEFLEDLDMKKKKKKNL